MCVCVCSGGGGGGVVVVASHLNISVNACNKWGTAVIINIFSILLIPPAC